MEDAFYVQKHAYAAKLLHKDIKKTKYHNTSTGALVNHSQVDFSERWDSAIATLYLILNFHC